MFASLIAVGLAGLPAAESAAWVTQLRTVFTAAKSVEADFTKTEFDRPGGNGRPFDCQLRLARRANGEWVGNLLMRTADRRESCCYTLWDGRVYESDFAHRRVTEYTPADGDPLRMAAQYFLPPLFLLGDKPGWPKLRPRLTGHDSHYLYHTMYTPANGSDLFWIGPGPPPEQLVRVTVATVVVDCHAIPRHLPRLIRSDGVYGRHGYEFDVRSVRVNADDGPTAVDITDPTVLPAGWRMVSMAKVWEDSRRAFEAAEREQQRVSPKR